MVARVNKEHAESLCDDEIRGGRGRRADHEVYLNKTLLTDAIRHSLADLQQVTVLRDRRSPVRNIPRSFVYIFLWRQKLIFHTYAT